MERIRSISRISPEQAKGRIQRIKVQSDQPTRVYDGGFTKDPKTGMLLKNEEFYKIIDGCSFKCWPDGNIKDQRSSTHVCWFGKITKILSDDELRICSLAVQKAMVKSFPELYYDLETGERKTQVCDDYGLILKRAIV